MALIKCPECGRENVSDSAEMCPGCGYAIRTHFEKIKSEELQQNKRDKNVLEKRTKEIEVIKLEKKIKRREFITKYKYCFVAVSLIIIILCILFAIMLYLQSDSKKYKDAQKLFDSGLYLEAKNIFLNMKDKESVEEDINNCNYNIAKQLLFQKQYDDAIDILGVVYGYADTLELINNARYGIAMNFLDSGNIRDAFEILYGFNNSEKYSEDIKRCIEEDSKAVFDFAQELYQDAQFDKALEIFQILNKNESSQELENYMQYCEEYIKIQGYWYNERDKSKYVLIDGHTIEIHRNIISESTIEGLDNKIINEGKYYLEPKILVNQTNNNQFFRFIFNKDDEGVTLSPPSGNLYNKLDFTRRYMNEEREIILISVYLRDDAQSYFWKVSPEIGMTADEVRKSTWGDPKKINKTMYKWGTSEQWCYSNYKYIYLEDGIVTAIQE